ncbi:DUF397 domain-containing protein [Bailinhaonella thermotolerans]|uniref:DUF397 domain-containing protein n=1 Tax=Bailinhaonella thermotolerans TaxID=1070861 RepID=A0A3A4B1T8_9ACTN|nr:DUF397 domain-containing protein [Bailinhaonella thermotolerans]RJL34138.1 DUF397 domain-containing protein [Bailinhaonella thermotolerans]
MSEVSRVVWRKGRRSGGNGGNCVEVTAVDGESVAAGLKAGHETLYLMRDSKNPDSPVLTFTPAEWEAFVLGVKDGEFDDLAEQAGVLPA